MRKIILNIAISLDGYISDTDGGFDWIVGQGDKSQDSDQPFDMSAFLESVDTIVMGSKAYEDCVLSGLETFTDKQILVATRRKLKANDNVAFISGDICSLITQLKEEDGKDIWLFGGGELAQPFIRKRAVDEYVIGIIPTILGSGRTLFKGDASRTDLHLDAVSVQDGITILVYSKRQI